MAKKIIVGGASGFWGDAIRSTEQLLKVKDIDYLVYDYLAEITMSIMARARANNPAAGFATDFVSAAMQPNLQTIQQRGIKVISNAGGVNPQGCAAALRQVIDELDLNLNVTCVTGDDVLVQAAHFAELGVTEMFSQVDFPEQEKVLSINAYLGAFPIAQALSEGADIVITGRCVDSAVTLAACIYEFGWRADQLNELAMGSLAGHILECGPQATGGNFTDWHSLEGEIDTIGYPLAEIEPSGQFVCTKPDGTSGLVSIGTVAEQMLYEIGDPSAYYLPDVCCDFSDVKLNQIAPNRVEVSGARGRFVPSQYKVCATYLDEFRGGTFMTVYGVDAELKANSLATAIFNASRTTLAKQGMPDFSETSIELIGAESQYGQLRTQVTSREVAMKIAARHPQAAGIQVLLREAVGLGLATPPGLSGFQGSRPKPSPVVRLFSFLLDKEQVKITLEKETTSGDFSAPKVALDMTDDYPPPALPEICEVGDLIDVPLLKLAWARSGDKGNKANIGIIARTPEVFPYICAVLTPDVVKQCFAHFMDNEDLANPTSVERFYLPGLPALNFLLHNVLGGGGVASLRNDAQGKGYAQLLLDVAISIPRSMAEKLE